MRIVWYMEPVPVSGMKVWRTNRKFKCLTVLNWHIE